ncbi:hypothetical protein LTS12_029803, partial [Elasticomyces elasticus]
MTFGAEVDGTLVAELYTGSREMAVIDVQYAVGLLSHTLPVEAIVREDGLAAGWVQANNFVLVAEHTGYVEYARFEEAFVVL